MTLNGHKVPHFACASCINITLESWLCRDAKNGSGYLCLLARKQGVLQIQVRVGGANYGSLSFCRNSPPSLCSASPRSLPLRRRRPATTGLGSTSGGNAGGIFAHNAATELDATTGLAIASFTMSPEGFAGGGQAGYNYQFAPNWVAGIEGDFQGTSSKRLDLCRGRVR